LTYKKFKFSDKSKREQSSVPIERIPVSGKVTLNDGKHEKTFHNIVTRSGAHYIASAVSGLLSEEHGGVPSNLRLGLGGSNATNSGVPGPTPSTPIAVDGAIWNGASYHDFRRTEPLFTSPPGSDLWKQADTVKVVNEFINIFATFEDALFDYTGGDVEIREIVVGIADQEPSADPFDVPSQKPYTVLSRAVFHDKIRDPPDTGPWYYTDTPFVKTSGGNLTAKYQFRFG